MDKSESPRIYRWTGNSPYLKKGNRLAHIVIAEQALGNRLPAGAVVHHWNRNRKDNRGENLVVCPDEAYHKLMHRRAAALDATGDANLVRCQICKKYDKAENVVQPTLKGGFRFRHVECQRIEALANYHKRKTEGRVRRG